LSTPAALLADLERGDSLAEEAAGLQPTAPPSTLMAEIEKRPYKQVARAQAQQRTREALLEAAVEEFTRGNWAKVSLEALARRAKVTKQTLLRHFGTKDGLLMQAMASSAAEMLKQRWSAPQGDIEGAVENVLDHYEAWGERSRRVGAWLESGPPALANLSQMGRQVHHNWIDYAFAPQLEQLHGKDLVRSRAALIVLCDVQTWWLLSHELGFARSEVAATLTNAIERLLGEEGEEEEGKNAKGAQSEDAHEQETEG
jgi:AcrR family transcriptional regulator